jgi:hypothetical protein
MYKEISDRSYRMEIQIQFIEVPLHHSLQLQSVALKALQYLQDAGIKTFGVGIEIVKSLERDTRVIQTLSRQSFVQRLEVVTSATRHLYTWNKD